uniref:Retrotransposon gag domain-containing protein n=1 Tax=Scleropages formosus TaxID=113540 RepID=A0A8C9WUC2_SCLFO
LLFSGCFPFHNTSPLLTGVRARGFRDSAEYAQLRTALTKQGEFLGMHSQSLQRIQENVDGLIQVLQTGRILNPAFQGAPATPAEPVPPTPLEASGTVTRIATPERYDGSPDQCQDFLMQCELVFECSPRMYQTDAAKIAFVLSLLIGPAWEWATAGWRTRPRTTYDILREKFEAVFDHPHAGRAAGNYLMRLTQGSRSMAEYALEFRPLAAKSGWNSPALLTCFFEGLNPRIQDELTYRGEERDFDRFVETAIAIDNLGRSRQPLGTSPAEDRLQKEERRQRQVGRLCLYCGSPEHLRAACPKRPPQGTS